MRTQIKPVHVVLSAAIAFVVVAGAWLAVPAAVSVDTSGGSAVDTRSDTMLSKSCKGQDNCVDGWTLTSRLGDMLTFYEDKLGRRNQAYRILGIEFTTKKRPLTWYPDFGKGLRDVIVRLTQRARHDRDFALFQLGHEAFHLIEPIKPNSTGSYFEEGLASYFAVAYMERIGVRGGAGFISESNYLKAYELVVRLAKQHKDFFGRLRRLRQHTRSFSRLTHDDIRAAFPEAPATIARQLAEPFAAVRDIR
ncbi:MAG: hypothetical protein ACR2PI_10760 [Hyphomicrobiaceae bacterium]